MSSVSEQDQLNPKDPLSYAPRWLREKRDAAPTLSPEPVDTQLEKAVSNALRHPLDPQVIEEPEELTRELRKMAVLSVAGRFAAAVGVSALVALFFVVMIPASRSPDGLNLSAAAMIESIKTALASQPSAGNAGAPTAPSELQSLLAATPPSEPVTREQSEQLLNQFVQWQQKPAAPQASQP